MSSTATGLLVFPSFWSHQAKYREIPGMAIATSMPDFAQAAGVTMLPLFAPTPDMLAAYRGPAAASSSDLRWIQQAQLAVKIHAASFAHQLVLASSIKSFDLARFQTYVIQNLDRHIPAEVIKTQAANPTVKAYILEIAKALLTIQASAAAGSYPQQVALVKAYQERAYDEHEFAIRQTRAIPSARDREEIFRHSYQELLTQRKPAIDSWLQTITPSTKMAFACWECSDDVFCHRVLTAKYIQQTLPALWARQQLPIGVIRHFMERIHPNRIRLEVTEVLAKEGKPAPKPGMIDETLVRAYVNPETIVSVVPAKYLEWIPKPRIVIDDLTSTDFLDDQDLHGVSSVSVPLSISHESTSPVTLPTVALPTPVYVPASYFAAFPFLKDAARKPDGLQPLFQAARAQGLIDLDLLPYEQRASLIGQAYPGLKHTMQEAVSDLAQKTRRIAEGDCATDMGRAQDVRESSPMWLHIENLQGITVSESTDDSGVSEVFDYESGGGTPGLRVIDPAWEAEPLPQLSLSDDEKAAVHAELAKIDRTLLEALTVPEAVRVLRAALPHRQDELDAFDVEHARWVEQERQKARRDSLDLLQERLNAPGTLAAKFGRQEYPWIRTLVTSALDAPDAPHPDVILAGTLAPEHPIADPENPWATARWVQQMAMNPELFMELTIDPDGPEHLSKLGLIHEAVLPSAALQSLWKTIEIALVREARETLWAPADSAKPIHPKLEQAIRRLAQERALDADVLLDLTLRKIVPAWKKRDGLFLPLALAFVTGFDQKAENGLRWASRIKRTGKASWIQPWIEQVAAVAYEVQNARHWKDRALSWGGLTPQRAQEIVQAMTSFEKEFIRVRLHSAFGFMSPRFGQNRITKEMSLGKAARQSRILAGMGQKERHV